MDTPSTARRALDTWRTDRLAAYRAERRAALDHAIGGPLDAILPDDPTELDDHARDEALDLYRSLTA